MKTRFHSVERRQGIRLTCAGALWLIAALGAFAQTEPRTWYVNPATGADANDGLAPNRAWRSAAKINSEARAGGAMTAGDALEIDTRIAPLPLGKESLVFSLDRIRVSPPSGQRYAVIKAEKTISRTSWSPTAGSPKVYQTDDTDTDIVLWENDKWLHHPRGETFAEVAANLRSTAGSFWTDGTTLYVHPLTEKNPAEHGDFTRSQFRPYGDSAVQMFGDNWSVSGLRVRKTCLARKTDDDPYVAYCFQQQGGSVSGTCTVRDCYFDYGSKHLLGFTANSAGSTVIAENVRCEQATPYVAFGGQSAFVSYMATGSGNTHIYRKCASLHNAGRIGHSTGRATDAYPVFITHGPAGAFTALNIIKCRWTCGPFVDEGTVASGGLTIDHSRLGETVLTSPNAMVRHSQINGWCPIYGGATLQDSHLVSMINYQGRSAAVLSGDVVIERCTLDLRANRSAAGYRLSPWSAAGRLALTFRHNRFLVGGTSDLTLVSGLTSSHTLHFSANSYDLGRGEWLIGSYGGESKTFSQWRALGFDLHSQNAP